MRRKKRNSETGFTLIELLLAGTILSLIMGAVVLSLSQVLTSIEHSRTYLEKVRTSQFVFQRLQREIASAFLPVDKESLVFQGKDSGSGETATDTLQFQLKMDDLSHLYSAGVYQVTYRLRPSEGGQTNQLVWAAAPLRGDTVGEEKEVILGEGIKGLNFQYYFRKGWSDSFDAESHGFLPQAVKITMALESAKEVNWQEMVVNIPSGGEK